MNKLVWLLNRLRAMGAAEVAQRVRSALHTRMQGWGIGTAQRPPAPDLGRFGQAWLTPLPQMPAPDAYRAAAERILAGRHDVFALHDAPLGMPPAWNRDPKTGTLAPLLFGKRLNYRDEAVVGDIKYLWEPNRHLAITKLAQAYHVSGEQRYADGVQTLLESWFSQCPYPLGPNWTSALELGIRLLNWSCCWQLLGGADGALFQSESGRAFRQRWLDSIYQHCDFIAGYFSRHSSANNHLFGELMGLHVAALTWPCWPVSAHWLALSTRELECEALAQTWPDGVNREQAIYYQHSVADIMLICCLLGRANGLPRSPAFMDRLEKMLEFIAALMDVSGNMPMIGDADDALLVHWSCQPDWHPYRSLLASGAVLFGRADFKAKAGVFDDKSLWLLGTAGRDAFDALGSAVPAAPTRSFPDGGYYVLGEQFDSAREVRLVADAGPLGYLSIAAHGHADALALTLSVGGMPILIDPGTYAYHTQGKWRDYFRGTSAHNTVRVDGQDQSESGGNFLWLRKANTRVLSWHSDAERDSLCAEHDGYVRLSDPVLHCRKTEYDKRSATIIVEDALLCCQEHELEWHWHFSPESVLSLVGNTLLVTAPTCQLTVTLPPGAEGARVVAGSDTPPLGWISRSYDAKVAAPCLVWRENIVGTTRRTTVFQIKVGSFQTTDANTRELS